MVIEIDRLVQNLDPTRTVLFFGAGSSIPSGSPSAQTLSDAIATRFAIEKNGYSLAEVSELAELSTDRSELIKFVRTQFPRPNPTGGLLNIPLYAWRGIYTTNYDELLERAYHIRGAGCDVITTNYDFSRSSDPNAQPVYKIHGTITHDSSDGHKSRMILTQGDYDKTVEYRDFLFNRLSSDMAGASLVIIGYSLSDPDIKEIVDRVLAIQSKMAGAGGQVYLILYQKDEGRARLFEARGIRVSFGGIDEFSEALARKGPAVSIAYSDTDDPVQSSKALSATTIDVRHSISAFKANASAMFNGWPATYADISGDLTFARTVSNSVRDAFRAGTIQSAAFVGASGVGKTTAARQVCVTLEAEGWYCWEHKSDFLLTVNEWVGVAQKLATTGQNAVLLVDDAYLHLASLNQLADELHAKGLKSLKLILTSGTAQWQYRTKSIYLTKLGKEFRISKLNSQEIDRLIMLVSGANDVRPLVEATFSGFSLQEKRRRLTGRCEADAFVCLRNIFAQEKFDDIILREYAQLNEQDQDIYRLVAAMEYAGIRVHRQLVLRLTGIAANMVGVALGNLVDVISEYDISERFGVYGWKVRHNVIAGIISKYKYADQESKIKLFDRVISSLSPTYYIERHSINDMCNVETGIPSVSSKEVQNRLLRALISVAPGEPIPRHRLIRNLIDLELFDLAETEIRVFRSDLGLDGPVARYEINLLLARAVFTPGILDEDRIVILRQAEAKAASLSARFENNKNIISSYCDVGLEIFRRTGDEAPFASALKALKSAESRTGDDEIAKAVRTYEKRRFNLDF